MSPSHFDRADFLHRPLRADIVFAHKEHDAIKCAGSGLLVTDSVDRHQLYATQTPQIFERALLEEAYRAVYAENVSVTDEVSAVEQLGHKVVLVLNDDFNFKITYPRDLPLVEFVLKQRESDTES